MDMELIREWLINKGIDPKELDELKEPPALSDIGEALMYTFQNDNQLGDLVMSLFFQVNDLATLVMEQQIELEELKNA